MLDSLGMRRIQRAHRRASSWRDTHTFLAIHTGQCKGELLGLRWQYVNFATRRLPVARSYDRYPRSESQPLAPSHRVHSTAAGLEKGVSVIPLGLLFPTLRVRDLDESGSLPQLAPHPRPLPRMTFPGGPPRLPLCLPQNW